MITANNSNEIPPFTPNEIVIQRIGKIIVQGKNRSIRVTLPSAVCVHYVFSVKRSLGDRNLHISSDQTKQQMEYYKFIKNNLQNRKVEGENNLFIKFVMVYQLL